MYNDFAIKLNKSINGQTREKCSGKMLENYNFFFFLAISFADARLEAPTLQISSLNFSSKIKVRKNYFCKSYPF